jgi:two-component system, NtrC family, response regulator AtoC
MRVTKTTIIAGTGSTGDRARGLRLLVMSAEVLATVPLPRAGVVTVGRSSKATVRIEDPLASREHVRLYLGGEILVEDLGSANGTVLREAQLPAHKPQSACPGEPIQVGSTVLMVLDAPATQPSAAGAQVRGPSGAMTLLQALAARAAASSISILLLGETGVGKEVLARQIHAGSPRAAGPLVAINCAGLPETLIESELFGYEKGAFTGALQAKTGLIEAAHRGTLFLDEVGEMPASVQAKLLRVLENREVLRVGAVQPVPVDVRFVAATNRDLESEAVAGRFRRDLFYRLNGLCLAIPPLRERTAEIAGLARGFITEMSRQGGRRPPALSAAVLDRLHAHPWPGNIRELRNVIERGLVMCDGSELLPEHVVLANPSGSARGGDAEGLRERALAGGPPDLTPAQREERSRIVQVLADCAWNQTRAAEKLGVSRRTLVAKLAAYRIPRPQKPAH